MEFDPQFLKRTLDLARLGGIKTSPNPNVGCLIVHEGEIIAEGYHKEFGGAHAEVEAFRALEQSSAHGHIDNRHITVYVSLEPCSYHGKTPACTDLLIEKKVGKVVVGTLDPNPKVSGSGVQRLKEAGIEVVVNEDRMPFEELITHFKVNQEKQRPFITLKWAETKDGFIAAQDGTGTPIRTQISGPEANQFVHQLRAERQAIMVGKKTLLIDNPRLTARGTAGPSPIRIVFDPGTSERQRLAAFDEDGKVIMISNEETVAGANVKVLQEIDHKNLEKLLTRLYTEMNIGSILVEGGAELHNSFLSANVWDELIVMQSGTTVGNGLAAPEKPTTEPQQKISAGSDIILTWKN